MSLGIETMHECPDCGVVCTCCGDIDDLNFGISDQCKHYLTDDCDYYDDCEYEDWDEDWPDDDL